MASPLFAEISTDSLRAARARRAAFHRAIAEKAALVPQDNKDARVVIQLPSGVGQIKKPKLHSEDLLKLRMKPEPVRVRALPINTVALKRATTAKNQRKDPFWFSILEEGAVYSLRDIQHLVAQHFNVSVKTMLSRTRKHQFVRPRQIAMVLARQFTAKSLCQIGAAFGGLDHTTVLNAENRIARMSERDPAMAATVDELRKKIVDSAWVRP